MSPLLREGGVEIAASLQGLGLERYEEASRDNAIDAKILPELTAEDLKEIGVIPVGGRRRLLKAIAALANKSGSWPPQPASRILGSSCSPSRAARRPTWHAGLLNEVAALIDADLSRSTIHEHLGSDQRGLKPRRGAGESGRSIKRSSWRTVQLLGRRHRW